MKNMKNERLRHATEELRHQLSRQLLDRVDRTAAKAADVPDDEIDAAIDEAADHVRHHPE